MSCKIRTELPEAAGCAVEGSDLSRGNRTERNRKLFPAALRPESQLTGLINHLHRVRWAVTLDRCQQLHRPIPLDRTAPTTIKPPPHPHSIPTEIASLSALDHNTSFCNPPHLLFFLLLHYTTFALSAFLCFHERYHHYGLFPLTQGQSHSHISARQLLK